MAESKPCAACNEQVKKGLYAPPHSKLSAVWSQAYRGSMFGGHEEYVYKCSDCEALICHMHDKNDFAPFWYFTDTIPAKA